ncbi:MAG TPA: cupin domain-containing protein [Anaerolineae bacterium]
MNHDEVKVNRWPAAETPTETTIRQILAQENLRPYQWSNGPGDVYSAHRHAYHKVIYVVEGSITFGLPDKGQSIELHPGDRLDLPAGVTHDATVGRHGVVCLEAHR